MFTCVQLTSNRAEKTFFPPIYIIIYLIERNKWTSADNTATNWYQKTAKPQLFSAVYCFYEFIQATSGRD